MWRRERGKLIARASEVRFALSFSRLRLGDAVPHEDRLGEIDDPALNGRGIMFPKPTAERSLARWWHKSIPPTRHVIFSQMFHGLVFRVTSRMARSTAANVEAMRVQWNVTM